MSSSRIQRTRAIGVVQKTAKAAGVKVVNFESGGRLLLLAAVFLSGRRADDVSIRLLTVGTDGEEWSSARRPLLSRASRSASS